MQMHCLEVENNLDFCDTIFGTHKCVVTPSLRNTALTTTAMFLNYGFWTFTKFIFDFF
jgi:hypothetical protein